MSNARDIFNKLNGFKEDTSKQLDEFKKYLDEYGNHIGYDMFPREGQWQKIIRKFSFDSMTHRIDECISVDHERFCWVRYLLNAVGWEAHYAECKLYVNDKLIAACYSNTFGNSAPNQTDSGMIFTTTSAKIKLAFQAGGEEYDLCDLQVAPTNFLLS